MVQILQLNHISGYVLSFSQMSRDHVLLLTKKSVHYASVRCEHPAVESGSF